MESFSVGQKVVCVADSPIWIGVPSRLGGERMHWRNYPMARRQMFEEVLKVGWELCPDSPAVEWPEVLGPYPQKVYEVAAVVHHDGRTGRGLELVGFDGVYESKEFLPLRETETSIEVFEEILNSLPAERELESTSGDDIKEMPIETIG